MNDMIGYDIQAVIEAFIFFLPAYVANTAAGFFGGGRPLDMTKKMWDGRRVFGEGKTIRGTIGGISTGVIFRFGQNMYHSELLSAGVFLAFLLASGAIVGDITGSFIKRRLGCESGESAPLLDQLDFVIGALFFASFTISLSLETIIILLIISPVGHLGVNIAGYLLHRKEVPW